MIEIKDLVVQKEDILLKNLDITVKNGEIYMLLYQKESYATLLCDILSGYKSFSKGKIVVEEQPLKSIKHSNLTVIQQVDNGNYFEPDLKLKDILELSCRQGGISKKRVLELLLYFDLFADDLDKKVRRCLPREFKVFYLSMMLAKDTPNIIIHDFIRGEERSFEMRFNGLLKQLKDSGKAILYFTGDIFYAYRMANRVSFLKNGHIVPAEPILSKDFEELDAMEVYKKYLS